MRVWHGPQPDGTTPSGSSGEPSLSLHNHIGTIRPGTAGIAEGGHRQQQNRQNPLDTEAAQHRSEQRSMA